MTISFQNHTIQIYRNRRIGSSNRYSMSATFTGYAADIQPATLDRQQFFPGRFGAVFSAYIDASADIKEGDQAHDEDGKVYSVKAVNHWDGGGVFGDVDHIELIMTSEDA